MASDPRSTPADWNTLTAYVLGDLPDLERMALEERLGQDADAAHRVQFIRSRLEAIRAHAAEATAWEVSPAQRAKLRELFAYRPANVWREVAERAREAVASLIFDGFAGGRALAGYRGAATARHLIYEANTTQIDLRVAHGLESGAGAAGRELQVIGQIHAEAAAREVIIRSLDGEERRVSVGEDGVFEASLPSGAYEVSVLFPEAIVVIPRLELAA